MSQPEKKEWEQGWEGHREAQLLRWAALSFREKLLWLDEAQDQVNDIKPAPKTPPKQQ